MIIDAARRVMTTALITSGILLTAGVAGASAETSFTAVDPGSITVVRVIDLGTSKDPENRMSCPVPNHWGDCP